MKNLWYGAVILATLAIIYQMYYPKSNQTGDSGQSGGAHIGERYGRVRGKRHWTGDMFNNYYYYDPWYAYPSPYNRLCDSHARRNCSGSWYPRDCFRREYNKCSGGLVPQTHPLGE